LLWNSRFRHAVVITPVGSLGRIALGTAYSSRLPIRQRRRPSPCQWRVGSHVKLFEACSTFTRVTACLIAGPPRGPLSRRLRRFRCLPRRSDSFRPERTRGRGEWLPLEFQNLCTAHTDAEFPPEFPPENQSRVEEWRGGLRLRFHSPLIKPDGPFSGIRLSDKATHTVAHEMAGVLFTGDGEAEARRAGGRWSSVSSRDHSPDTSRPAIGAPDGGHAR
jgi:hypothetical protein